MVFAALGLPAELAMRYHDELRRSGRAGRARRLLELADDPPAERLIAPRCALTCAEHLAFDCGMHVLVVLHDMTNYGEALREVAAARGEVPSRKGYPGYLYSDLASLFERAGRIHGRPGSLTQLPIVTLPSGDMTHPIPDLTGYVTEGQIVLDRDSSGAASTRRSPCSPSLSRLMADGIGAGRTRADHEASARGLYAAWRAPRARGPSRRSRPRGSLPGGAGVPRPGRGLRAPVPVQGLARPPDRRDARRGREALGMLAAAADREPAEVAR